MDLEYLTDKKGKPKAVIIPIALWRRLLPKEEATLQELQEALEDYCLNKAMDEAAQSPLLSREEALAFLKE